LSCLEIQRNFWKPVVTKYVAQVRASATLSRDSMHPDGSAQLQHHLKLWDQLRAIQGQKIIQKCPDAPFVLGVISASYAIFYLYDNRN
jgi:hypothetical protein